MKMHPEHQPEIREGSELFRAPRSEMRGDQIGLSSLAVLGLLCHALIFWLLSFPYVYTYDPYYQPAPWAPDGFTFVTTGWQTPGVILILPCLFYLACLLPVLRKSKWLEVSMRLNAFVNVGGFLLLYGRLFLSQWGSADGANQTHWRDAAYGSHLTFLFLAALCSSVSSLSLGLWLQQNKKLR